MHGSNQYVFRLWPGKLLAPRQSHAVGRILVHGLVLAGYLLFDILTPSTPSDDTLLEWLLETICISERQSLEQAMQCIFLEETMRLKLAGLFSQYDTMGIPNPYSLKDLLQSVASFVTIQKPFYVLGNVKAIILNQTHRKRSCRKTLWWLFWRCKFGNTWGDSFRFCEKIRHVT